jgi:hypothetical protein
MEGEHLYPRLGGIEYAFVLVGTGHLTLQTTGTLARVYMQGSLHGEISFVDCQTPL